MSVRNHYAHNYSKVGPMPPNSLEMKNVQNAILRRNTNRQGLDTDLNGKDLKINDYLQSKHSYRRYSDVSSTSSEQSFRGIYRPTAKSDAHAHIDRLSNKNKQYTVDKKDMPRNRSDKSSSCSDKESVSVSPKLERSKPRPKSARPESRWQRRDDDDDDLDAYLPVFDSDSESDISHKTEERPMSARPDSRVARMQAHNPNPLQDKEDNPSRPKTSHGRQKPDILAGTYQAQVPKQVITKQKKHVNGWKFEPNEKWKRKGDNPKSDKTEVSPGKVSQKIKTPQTDENYKSHAKANAGRKYTLRKIDDILFGSNDEYLDTVDPVEFFNCDSDQDTFFRVPRNSLSKGTVKHITNDTNSVDRNDKKYQSSLHANNPNKRILNSEANDRHHGNGALNPKNIMANQSMTSSQQTRNKNDSINARSNHVRDSMMTKRVPVNSETRVLSLKTGERVHMEFPFQKAQGKNVTNKGVNVVAKQPRKLKPISPLHNRLE